MARCIEEAGIGFCFAPRYHPAMRHVGPTRRELGVPTAFNLLGPLANPGRARYQLVGVGDGRVAERLATVLGAAGADRAWVVHGHDGLDELSTVAPSTVVEWRAGAGELVSFVVDPAVLGLAPARPEELTGGDPAANAAATGAVLAGAPGPHRDIVLLNAAAALVIAGHAGDLAEGLQQAAESVDRGAAATALQRLVSHFPGGGGQGRRPLGPPRAGREACPQGRGGRGVSSLRAASIAVIRSWRLRAPASPGAASRARRSASRWTRRAASSSAPTWCSTCARACARGCTAGQQVGRDDLAVEAEGILQHLPGQFGDPVPCPRLVPPGPAHSAPALARAPFAGVPGPRHRASQPAGRAEAAVECGGRARAPQPAQRGRGPGTPGHRAGWPGAASNEVSTK